MACRGAAVTLFALPHGMGLGRIRSGLAHDGMTCLASPSVRRIITTQNVQTAGGPDLG
ncbi:hypothetical protein GCM10018954_092170 [Kutzneria kofuensis]